MRYNAIYLTINEPSGPSAFLQHIHNFVQFPVVNGSTYNDMFSKLKDAVKSNPDFLQAAEEFILFNLEEQEDKSLFDTVIVNGDGLFAMFDFVPERK